MDLKKKFLFFKNLHKNQNYSDWSPYWPHLLRVGNILQYYLELFKECDKKTINSIIIAGYGHDSLEDTSITKEELEKQFDKNIAELIFWMTNEENDAHTSKYVKKVTNWSEEVRLIKLADMCDNYTSIIYRAVENWPKFLKEKIIPIMEPMYKSIIKTSFKRHPKTGNELLKEVQKYHQLATTFLNDMLS